METKNHSYQKIHKPPIQYESKAGTPVLGQCGWTSLMEFSSRLDVGVNPITRDFKSFDLFKENIFNMAEHISLYYREGSSDKVYQTFLEEKDGGYVVNFAYGRRGAKLSTGSKTPNPISLDAARKIYQRLVNEKKAKGYKVAEGTSPSPYTKVDPVTTRIQCQLLNPIEEAEVDGYLNSDQYVAQEKHDGMRMLLHKSVKSVNAVNRRGITVGTPELFNDLLAISEDFIIDGEYVNGEFRAFDLLELNNTDLRPIQYATRLNCLAGLIGVINLKWVKLTETAFSTERKISLFQNLLADNKEGIVFKRWDAPYTSGRPSSKRSQLKYKFYTSASFIVSKVNDNKRSVALALIDPQGQHQPAGNVSIPPNADIPTEGMVIDVRYLYAFRQSGSVYQPTYVGVRKDIAQEECMTSQLKFKPEIDD